MAPIQVFVQTRRPHKSHGYYCAICPVKNPTQIMTCAPAYGLGTSKKKKPYADYDLRPRPMAWAQVKKER